MQSSMLCKQSDAYACMHVQGVVLVVPRAGSLYRARIFRLRSNAKPRKPRPGVRLTAGTLGRLRHRRPGDSSSDLRILVSRAWHSTLSIRVLRRQVCRVDTAHAGPRPPCSCTALTSTPVRGIAMPGQSTRGLGREQQPFPQVGRYCFRAQCKRVDMHWQCDKGSVSLRPLPQADQRCRAQRTHDTRLAKCSLHGLC